MLGGEGFTEGTVGTWEWTVAKDNATERRERSFARRREDVMSSEAMLSTVRFLMTRPTCDQISQEVVLSILARHQPRSCVITLFGADGSLHGVGTFGLTPAEADRYGSLSLWDVDPMADAVRTGDPVIVVDEMQASETYPRTIPAEGPFEPIGVWPLSLPNQRVGALQVTFVQEPDSDDLRSDAMGVSAVLALYLSLLVSVAASPDRAVEMLNASDQAHAFPTNELAVLQSAAGGGQSRRAAPSVLTERQTQILQLMAKGLTNSQIAKRVGFSESTVRQETMVVYRYFGVGGRREAVRLASLRGMLEESTS